MGRYTEAVLPDGHHWDVCLVLGGHTGLMMKQPGSKMGAAVLLRLSRALAVVQWP